MTLTEPPISPARQALARGDLPGTARAAQGMLATRPDHAEALFLLGLALAGMGQVREGIARIAAAVARDPQGEYRAQLARLLIMTRQDSAAAQVLAEAELALPDDALSRDTMGCVYARLGDHAASLPHFAHAVAQAPDNLDYRYNHAAALNFVGAVDEADAALEALLALAPGHARAHHLLAACGGRAPMPITCPACAHALPRRANRTTGCCSAMPWPRSWTIWGKGRPHSPLWPRPMPNTARACPIGSPATRPTSTRSSAPGRCSPVCRPKRRRKMRRSS
jgi:tetratricopeptide (TPR) repeat protein